jgi:transposase
VKPSDRKRLKAILKDRNAAQKHVWRAQIVLLTAEGLGTNEIMRRTGTSKTCVWRWQERFMKAGIDGLLRDKTRPSRIPSLGADVAERVVKLTLSDPPGSAAHWTGSMTAKACSRLNAVEGFFAKLAKQRLKRGVFRLQSAIKHYIEETNQMPKPFVWTADPNKIVAAVKREHRLLDSIH